MKRRGGASRKDVEGNRMDDSPRRIPSTLFLDAVLLLD
jgi:hypothetical protein